MRKFEFVAPHPFSVSARVWTSRPLPSELRGVSVLQLLITLVAAAILLTAGAPSFFHTAAGADRTAAVNGLVAAVMLARNAAIMRGEDVVLCKAPAPDARACARGDLVAWHTGALVFVNLDGDDPPTVDSTEPVLFVREARANVSIQGNREAFVFRPFDRRATNGTFVVCDRRGADHARAVIVSYSGRPRVSATAADGSDLECDRS